MRISIAAVISRLQFLKQYLPFIPNENHRLLVDEEQIYLPGTKFQNPVRFVLELSPTHNSKWDISFRCAARLTWF